MRRVGGTGAAVAFVAATVAALLWSAGPEQACAQPSLQQGVTVRDLFVRANQLYEAGEFEEAVRTYEEAAARGAFDPALYYNLGNAYYKAGYLGKAVLNYERALRIAPRNDDARANLALVRSLLRDRQFLEEPGLPSRIATWVQRRLNVRESLAVTSFIYLALVLVVIGFIFRNTSLMARLYPKVSMISPGRFLGLDKTQDFALAMATLAVLLAASGANALQRYHDATSRRAAIVVEEEVPVYGGPSEESTLQFKIHEGTRVVTGEARPGWVQIRLPGDLTGWISDRTVERI